MLAKMMRFYQGGLTVEGYDSLSERRRGNLLDYMLKSIRGEDFDDWHKHGDDGSGEDG